MNKILLDATSIPPQPVGAGIYIQHLVREMLFSRSNFEYFVFAHKNDFCLFNLDDSYRERFLFLPDFGRGSRIFLEQIYYPKIIAKQEIDLFHGLHYSFPLIKTCPKIVTIHDLTYFTNPGKHIWIKRYYFQFFIKKACQKADQILTVSNNTKEDLIKILGCDIKKITTTQLGVDAVFFEEESDQVKEKLRQKYELPNNFILFIGLIEPRKNVPLLIKAYLNLVDHQNLDCDLVIAGRWGWESEAILAEIKQHPNCSKIHFLGYIEESEKPALYQLAKIFVYPSMYEGFGLPVLESMASGTPVITTNISSMPEIVKDCGILIEPNNQIALENAIMTLVHDSSLRETFSKKGKLRAHEFSWQNTVNQTLLAYEKVLQDKGKL